jgi:hypothetical protein
MRKHVSFICVYDSFSNAGSISDCTASNRWKINNNNCRGCGRKRSRNLPWRTEENYESLLPGRDSKRALFEYKSGTLLLPEPTTCGETKDKLRIMLLKPYAWVWGCGEHWLFQCWIITRLSYHRNELCAPHVGPLSQGVQMEELTREGHTPKPLPLAGEGIVTCQRIARQQLDKHPAIRARNNRTNVYSSLLGSSQCANGLARWLSRDLFSVRGPCREDMREYGNGNWLHLSSQVPREQQCGQKKN